MKELVGRNMPEEELLRSPAAKTIGDLAQSSGLFLSHFEHRHHLELPGHWMPEGRPDLTGEAHWNGGHLIEHKYRHFSYDNPVGSFHPAHRAKWTAHELCHGLVGFAWWPEATPFEQTITAWLSELLPVALWYFFDEHQLRRCPIHNGPLFGQYCQACERAALEGPTTEAHDDWLVKGRAFVEDQLAAIARSRRSGRIHNLRYASIDLANDGLNWVAAHRERLNSPEYRHFRTQFLKPVHGAFEHLDDLEARVVELMEAISGGTPAQPWAGTPELWAAQDLGWRLTTIAAQSDREVGSEIESMVESLAENPAAIGRVIEQYEQLHNDWIIPAPSEVFAVGYPLPHGYGHGTEQLSEGIATICEFTCDFLDENLATVVEAFSRVDPAHRRPIGLRFAQYLAQEAPGPLADLARYEAAIAHAGYPDPELEALATFEFDATMNYIPTEGITLLDLSFDMTQLMNDAIEDLDLVVARAHTIALRRTAGGDLVVAEISTAAAHSLRHGGLGWSSLPPDEANSLVKLGFVRPENWIQRT